MVSVVAVPTDTMRELSAMMTVCLVASVTLTPALGGTDGARLQADTASRHRPSAVMSFVLMLIV